jgi:hypothetical protein
MGSRATTTGAPSPSADQPRNRLPTLFEVLSRRTLAPVDLYSFYIYMRDQQRSVDYLDFWCVELYFSLSPSSIYITISWEEGCSAVLYARAQRLRYVFGCLLCKSLFYLSVYF